MTFRLPFPPRARTEQNHRGAKRKSQSMSAEELQQVAILAGPLESCSLNGKPARLETEQGKKRTMFRIVSEDGHSAVFNPSVIHDVITKQGGRFHTREQRRFGCV